MLIIEKANLLLSPPYLTYDLASEIFQFIGKNLEEDWVPVILEISKIRLTELSEEHKNKGFWMIAALYIPTPDFPTNSKYKKKKLFWKKDKGFKIRSIVRAISTSYYLEMGHNFMRGNTTKEFRYLKKNSYDNR